MGGAREGTGREGKGREGKGGGKREGRGSSLRARCLAAGIGGRIGWGVAVRDQGRVLLLSTIFFLLTFMKFLT